MYFSEPEYMGSRNEVVYMGMDPLAITHNDSLGKFLLPVPITLSFIGTEMLVPSGGMPLPVNIKSELEAQISD